LETGKHISTSNKGPIALAYRELSDTAAQKGLLLRFEGTVMSGTPALHLGIFDLAGCDVTEVYGILNGTTNYILSRMEEGFGYEEALKEAQEKGYAEAVPDADVEGWDALGKVVILANTVMGAALTPDDVSCEGITKISKGDVERAKAEGMRYKLIGRVRKEGGKVLAAVAPERLPLSNPLAAVMGATNAVTFCTDLMGDVTLVGAGAGRAETGFSILADLLDIHRFARRGEGR
jgi:homoserine dehydrogenase